MTPPPPPGDATGAILAGGMSNRMGTDKAFVELGGRPLIEWVDAALGPVLPRRIVVGRATAPLGLAAFPDTVPGGHGPLAGLDTAFRTVATDVVLVAVDQPLLRTDTVRRLMEVGGGDIVIPTEGGILQTTCALYRASCAPVVADLLATPGGALRDLVGRVEAVLVEENVWRSWGEDGSSWFGVDTPERLEEVRRRLGNSPPTLSTP